MVNGWPFSQLYQFRLISAIGNPTLFHVFSLFFSIVHWIVHVFWGRRTRSLCLASAEFCALYKKKNMKIVPDRTLRFFGVDPQHTIWAIGMCVCVKLVCNKIFKLEIFVDFFHQFFFFDLWMFPHLLVY